MSGILIRDMLENDISEIVLIENKSFAAPWSETSFLNQLRSPLSINRVAVLGDLTAGYVCSECVAGEGQVLRLAVRPDCRRMRIATSLLESVIDNLRLKACRVLYLEVRASDSSAGRLYQKTGFKVVGTRKGYYTEPAEDALIMRLEL